jgi:hypothetical protein
LFGFDYVWELFVPPVKRRWGWYVLPILFRDRLVGRIEPRIDRDEGCVRVLNLWWEDSFDPRRVEGFVDAMQAALRAYLHFAGASRLEWAPHLGNERRLSSSRCSITRLVVELTESTIMADPTHALEILGRLDTMGVQLSIDDFGTGYSSMAYLKSLPVHELKVDRSFVSQMLRSSNDAVIVHSTVDLGRNLGLRVVAEGVEDALTLQQLDLLGCHAVQGYHISRPVAADELMSWLDQQPSRATPPRYTT